jgi:outer membrane protein assembly factor BamB
MKQPRGWIIATPTEYKGNIYFGTSDAHIFYCMDKNDGKVIWKKQLNMRVYCTSFIENDIVYFGTFDGKILGLDYLTGEIKWEFQTEKSKLNYSTMYNEDGEFKEGFQLYGNGFEESEATIHALGSILSSPVIDGKVIYFGSSDGYLYAVRLK